MKSRALDDEDKPVRIDAGHVARAERAVAEIARGFFRVVPVAQRDILAGRHDFADLLGTRAHRPAVFPQHFKPRVSQSLADRAELVVQPFGRQIA